MTFNQTLLAVAFTFSLVSSALGGEVGKPAPDFTLNDHTGKERTLSEFKGKFVVLEWLNHGCPYVKKHYHPEAKNMQKLQKEFTSQNVVWLSIVSSANGKQGHMTAQEAAASIQEKGASPTAILLDPQGKTGKAYGAKVTPHMFIIDPKGTLIYNGAIDSNASSRVSTIQGATNYVRQALAEAMAGKKVSTATTQPYGCSIKYE